jgi:hypothetical protein
LRHAPDVDPYVLSKTAKRGRAAPGRFLHACGDRSIGLVAGPKESHMIIAGIVFVSSLALYLLEQIEDLKS